MKKSIKTFSWDKYNGKGKNLPFPAQHCIQHSHTAQRRHGIVVVSYNFAVESLKIAIVFKPKLYEYPKDNFSLKIIGKNKLIKKTRFDWSIVT